VKKPLSPYAMAFLDLLPHPRTAILSGACLIAIIYPIWLLAYRLFFSPLSKLPGPWLTKISTVPEANALKQQRRARWVNELFEETGAICVRTGPNYVSFRHPDAVKAIYGKRD
jgi:benzoate 4-monooxygenase